MKVEIRTTEPIRVAYLRAIGPYKQTFPTLWPKFAALAGERGLFRPGAKTLSVCHDNPRNSATDQLRGDACVTVDDSFAGDDVLKVQTIPAGRFAVASYVGPFEGLPDAYAELFQKWLPSSGEQLRQAASYEIYVTDPRTTPPAESVTEIHLPIE